MEPFSELKLGGVALPNRLIMAPVKTACGNLTGVVSHRRLAFYRRRAEGGVSFSFTIGMAVHEPSGITRRGLRPSG